MKEGKLIGTRTIILGGSGGGGESARPTATGLLVRAREHMDARASQYDKPEGERSMGKAVEAFNAITGRDLSEPEGWLLLQVQDCSVDVLQRSVNMRVQKDRLTHAAQIGHDAATQRAQFLFVHAVQLVGGDEL